ncbi:pyridoxamine 5'-phosphate oxidase family protein [Echinicola salinicaeni]|uniref:pyridoxamine 5'-phosphate oxidase family protein n=1 Tax=Echinicola salinicaeni TaxID=2762757 RepID=UPI0016489B14|nr:pyridoxamine 5'-phosphate oxidase family protein [Echinicola salinicaeni]
MIGTLTNDQISHVLYGQNIGRIACQNNGKIYIVPISYAFDKGFIYGHSKLGMKIKMMRKVPNVCFQVDSIDNMTNWRSVIIWGEYEELTDEVDYRYGIKLLEDKLTPFVPSTAIRSLPEKEHSQPEIVQKSTRPIVFRIRILEQTGRYEKYVH